MHFPINRRLVPLLPPILRCFSLDVLDFLSNPATTNNTLDNFGCFVVTYHCNSMHTHTRTVRNAVGGKAYVAVLVVTVKKCGGYVQGIANCYHQLFLAMPLRVLPSGILT